MKGGDSYEIPNLSDGNRAAAGGGESILEQRADGSTGPIGSDDQRPKEVVNDEQSKRPNHILPGRAATGTGGVGILEAPILSSPKAGGNLSNPTGAPVAESVGNSVENAPFPPSFPPSFPPVENNENPPVAPTGGKSLEVEESADTYSESAIQWGTAGIDSIKASKNTWCFRLRWTNPDGSRPQIRLMNVSDHVYRSITRNRRNYAAFKKQLISGYQSAVRANQEPL